VRTRTISVVIERDGRNYYAYCDDYPGTYGMGTTIQEAKSSLLWALRIRFRQNRPTPEPGPGDRERSE
jgi:hypothetical protein